MGQIATHGEANRSKTNRFPKHHNSKNKNSQVINLGKTHKVIHHLAKKSLGERKVFSKPELKLLEIVQVRGWYGKKISKSNAQSIKNNLQQGTITEGRVLDTLRILGHDVKTIVNSKKP